MATPENCFTWKNGSGTLEHYRPYYALPDEMQNFFATDKTGMMGFLVGVHSSKMFDTGFKREEGIPQHIDHPYFSFLGCATPEWFMGNLKVDLFSGGAGRRFMIVHDKKTVLKPFPRYPPRHGELYARMINYLHCLKEYHGQSDLDPAAFPWWEKWYLSREQWPNREDPIIAQFHETKPMMVFKIALLISLNELPFQQVIREEHLRIALAMLDELEPKVIRLTSGIGRNILAGLGADLLDKIEIAGGAVMEKKFRMMFFRNLRDIEWQELLKHFTETGQLIYAGLEDAGVTRGMLFLPDSYVRTFHYECRLCKRKFHKPGTCCGSPLTDLLPASTP
jgi:hypothetical protein